MNCYLFKHQTYLFIISRRALEQIKFQLFMLNTIIKACAVHWTLFVYVYFMFCFVIFLFFISGYETNVTTASNLYPIFLLNGRIDSQLQFRTKDKWPNFLFSFVFIASWFVFLFLSLWYSFTVSAYSQVELILWRVYVNG